MNSTPPPTPPVLPHHTPPLRLTRKTKLANFEAIFSLVVFVLLLFAMPFGFYGLDPIEGIVIITIFAFTIGASLAALRLAQLPYKIVAAIPFLICVFYLFYILYVVIADFSNRWDIIIEFWRYRIWSYNYWH